MRKLFFGILAALCPLSVMSQTTVTIVNPTSLQRQELISIDASQLGFDAANGVVVRDAFGIERTSQLTYDGRLLLDIHVRPHSQTTYTLQSGTPAAVLSSVSGRQYPERLDDIAFENDRIGFRLYGPALQRKGEKGFGHDVWVKRTTELVLEELYRNDPRLSFHLDYGKALDCYGVGPTLGCGTPCMLRNGKIVYPWCYDTYKILDKGPLRFTVQVDFPATADGITEHRILSLDKGSNFCEAWVWYDGLTRPIDIAAGLAIRPADTTTVVMRPDYIHYADPTVDPARHQFQVYSALLFPAPALVPASASVPAPASVPALASVPAVLTAGVFPACREGHALGILKNYRGGRFHYFFGAAWSEFDVRSQGEWQLRIEGFMEARRHPLQVIIQK